MGVGLKPSQGQFEAVKAIKRLKKETNETKGNRVGGTIFQLGESWHKILSLGNSQNVAIILTLIPQFHNIS